MGQLQRTVPGTSCEITYGANFTEFTSKLGPTCNDSGLKCCKDKNYSFWSSFMEGLVKLWNGDNKPKSSKVIPTTAV